MKIYAIQYELINESMNYYIITCKFLSTRRNIDESYYFELKKVFNVSHKNNSYMSGIYFDNQL